MDTILSYQPNVDIVDLSLKFDTLGFFTYIQHQDKFNFIDVLKGFVSFDLCTFISHYLLHSNLVSLIIQVYDNIHEDCSLLWQDCYSGFTITEEALGFTYHFKRLYHYK
ncbi:hypothetical protein RCL_jg6417.t1 [Rhizophagus clarus]|uniref:Uncharacterized protein n=1 Tax=Rhizophagus clarus TaxID=94130 RepID=A0A8H3LX51_9GLOM|nr:hypothetical protein RCL_jg6417.t1 [Rhizophagus clarus]